MAGKIYFASDMHSDAGVSFANVDLYEAKGVGESFTGITQLTAISEPSIEDVSPTETPDGKTLFFARGDEGQRHLMRSDRPSPGDPYSSASELPKPYLAPGAIDENDPYVVGTALYFSSREASGEPRLLVAKVNAITEAPLPLAGLPAGKHRFPVLNQAQTELYYVKYVGGNFDGIFRALRANAAAPFETVVRQTQFDIKSMENVNVTGMSPDGCFLYLAARLNSTTGFVSYVARRKP